MILNAASLLPADRNEYFKKWQELEKASRFDEAITVFKTAAAEYPDEAWFRIFIAHSCKMLGKPDAALPFYREALKLKPDDAGIKGNVYSGYLAYAGHRGFKRGDWKGSAAWYKKAAALMPEDFTAYNLLGNALRNGGQYEESYFAFLKSFEINPGHVTGSLGPNFRVGVIEGMKNCLPKNKKRAVQFADLGVRALAADREVSTQAMLVYLGAGEFEQAKKLAGGMPAGTEREMFAAMIMLKTGKTDEAERTFDRLSRRNAADYLLDDRIAKIYRSEIEALDYTEQMSSPFQDRALDYNTRAVVKYFKAQPYIQAISITPPLRGIFGMGQGAGGKSFHNGLGGHYSFDLVQEMGAPEYAVADGEVLFADDSNPDNPIGSPVNVAAKGNGIIISHGAVKSLYWHIKKGSAGVKKGDRVSAGQKIAEMGNSGVSGGPHLHFQMLNAEDYTVPPGFTGLFRRKKADGGEWEAAKTFDEGYEFKYGD